jgi:hypothetical protein
MRRADRSREALLVLDGQMVVLYAGRPYEFNGAGRLLEDFWIAVDRMLTLREE